MSALERFLSAYRAKVGTEPRGTGGQLMARCPAHEDGQASLSVAEGADGRVLMHCHAGCDLSAILHALSLEPGDLFAEGTRVKGNRTEIVATYDYTDEAGELLFQVVRMLKDGEREFRQRRPKPGGGWEWKRSGTRLVLYRLPAVLEAVALGQTIYVTEGEKDVHALERQGMVATTNPGGAAKWEDSYTEALRGAHVVLWGDRDAPGYAHVEKVSEALRPAVKSLSVCEGKIGKDAADHLGAGMALDDVVWLERPVPSSWERIDLGPYLDGTIELVKPAYLPRVDGEFLLYPGKVHTVSAEPESGKGWLVLAACAERLNAGDYVLYVDFEDGPATISERMLALMVEPDVIRERMIYLRPEDALGEQGRALVEDFINNYAPTLCVADGVTEAMHLHGWSIKENDDVAAFLKAVPRLMVRGGAAVILIDHVVKDRESRGRFAIGGQHKLAGVDVALKLDVVHPFGRGREGVAKITVDKDRPGYLRAFAGAGKHLARLHLESTADGLEVLARLELPKLDSEDDDAFLMDKASRVLELSMAPMTKNGLTDAMGEGYGRNRKRDAIQQLIDKGYIQVTKQSGAHLLTSIRSFAREREAA